MEVYEQAKQERVVREAARDRRREERVDILQQSEAGAGRGAMATASGATHQLKCLVGAVLNLAETLEVGE
ncbi:hypothetical protein LCGC14_0698510 [marine sediment metagenome]|uniref:Uncharacterized protein n=1 Tax=marine sediment metagenome TaxID=412755 RepID=A0A0F9R3V8_9ZZZZ